MAGDAVSLIEQATRRVLAEVPALAPLRLVVSIELRARGDVQHFSLKLPEVEVKRGLAQGAKVSLSMRRDRFNELAPKAGVEAWKEAFERGRVLASGPPQILKLITMVVERRRGR